MIDTGHRIIYCGQQWALVQRPGHSTSANLSYVPEHLSHLDCLAFICETEWDKYPELSDFPYEVDE